MADIVDDFLTRLQSLVPDIPAHVPHQLEATLRQAWGGTEPYVGKRQNRERTLLKIGSGLRDRKPLPQVFKEAGVSRAGGYRLLQRR